MDDAWEKWLNGEYVPPADRLPMLESHGLGNTSEAAACRIAISRGKLLDAFGEAAERAGLRVSDGFKRARKLSLHRGGS